MARLLEAARRDWWLPGHPAFGITGLDTEAFALDAGGRRSKGRAPEPVLVELPLPCAAVAAGALDSRRACLCGSTTGIGAVAFGANSMARRSTGAGVRCEACGVPAATHGQSRLRSSLGASASGCGSTLTHRRCRGVMDAEPCLVTPVTSTPA